MTWQGTAPAGISRDKRRRDRTEWPTLIALAVCYAVWIGAVVWLSGVSAIAAVALAVALHSSLQHEAIHGHPFRNQRLNALLVAPNLGLLIPYVRFRDTHLDHHLNADLTDPYDDPESNYLDPAVWGRLPRLLQALLIFNNTLFGRVLVGVAVSQAAFVAHDWRMARTGDARVRRGWAWHVPAVLPVLALVWVSPLGLGAYLIAAYAGLSIVKIRTFLEHQAHERAAGRTVIIEDRGPLSVLFLNNNLHVVHHAAPNVPWYDLPALYQRRKDRFQTMNGGYVYRSYGDILRRYLFRTKDPVPHPLWRAR